MMEQKKIYSTLHYGRDFKMVKTIKNQYVHVYDYIESEQLLNLISRAGIPDFIFSDHYTFYHFDGPVKIVGSALVAEYTARINQKSKFTSDYQTNYTFNFACNKKQINRYLLIKLVEIFKFKNYDYTWSGAGQKFDLTQIIDELNQINFTDENFRSMLLSEILEIQPRWINNKSDPNIDINKTGYISNFGGLVWPWNNGLNNIYEQSAISLIAESVKFEKAAIFTEKTVFSVMGCTLPIWIGGYKQASEWQRIGFDIFDDIIDHSYQNYDTLFERCYYAFKDNFELLSDKNLAARVRHSVLNRLLENKTKLVDTLASFNDSVLKQTPDDFQTLVKPIIARFRI